MLPNVAGYVGADRVAMLLATRTGEAQKTTLAIDIGTNTEGFCLNYPGQADQRRRALLGRPSRARILSLGVRARAWG